MEAATLTPMARGRRVLASDEHLVVATRLGDDRAFETLYHRYHRRIAAYVVGMVKDHQRAEDVTQEVFLSALRRMRATDREIVFKPWIYEIAKNACIDQFRRARRTDEVSYDADEGGVAPLVSARPGPDEAVESRKQLDDLCGAFGGLSDSHHQILVLRELEGRSYQEIGERLNMTRPAVESTLFRARKRLSEEYGELVTGERCRRVQAIIAGADTGSLGVRDRRTMARHVSHCQPCRRAAALAGLEQVVPARVGVRAKIAAALPLPAFLRDRWLGVGGSHAASAVDGGGGAGAGLVAWLHASAPMADNASGWVKAVAAAATVAAAGVGAGAVVSHGNGSGTPGASSTPTPAQATPATRPAASRSTAVSPPASTAARPRPAHRAAGTDKRAHRSAASAKPAAVTPTAGLGQRASAATPTPPAPVAKRPSGPSSSSTTGTAAPAAPTPANPVVHQATTTAGAATQVVQGTLTSATQALPPPPAIPSVTSVVDTQATVPTLGDVTQQVGETVDQTLQNAQGAVDDVTNGLQGAVTGLSNLSPGG